MFPDLLLNILKVVGLTLEAPCLSKAEVECCMLYFSIWVLPLHKAYNITAKEKHVTYLSRWNSAKASSNAAKKETIKIENSEVLSERECSYKRNLRVSECLQT